MQRVFGKDRENFLISENLLTLKSNTVDFRDLALTAPQLKIFLIFSSAGAKKISLKC
jgi:hypothetical protein